jgi:glucose/arabinose dehydrogenase
MRPLTPRWILLLALSLLLTSCESLRAWVIRIYPQDYPGPATQQAGSGLAWPLGIPAYDGPDVDRARVDLTLKQVAQDFSDITDLQFVPGSSHQLVVLQKSGEAIYHDLRSGKKQRLFKIDVPTKSEQGLLGWAFHPDWASNGRVFINHSHAGSEGGLSRISEWHIDPQNWAATPTRTILELAQPYANHNAGQLVFGPDGYLYIGWGDGGWRDDPHDHGQNPRTWLGSMLRIDINPTDPDAAYAIPLDNPFIGNPNARPEVWAYGLRNPWRISFAPDGRLVVADVGQNAWEEVTIVDAGENHGWRLREGRHCLDGTDTCQTTGLTDPVFEYDHDAGESITGGFVYTGKTIAQLHGKYVFCDFVSGRFWAIDLPTTKGQAATGLVALGRWPILPSTFGQGADGEIYVASFGNGRIYRVESLE